MRKCWPWLLGAALALAAPGSSAAQAPRELSDTPALRERSVSLRVDGDPSDWPAGARIPIHPRDPDTGEPDPTAAPVGWAQLAFDSAFLYLALTVPDDTLAFPERSWRFGDGFYLTVLTPGTGSHSRDHVSFGFSRVGNTLVKTVVNRSGEYFPRVGMADVAFAMHPSPTALALPATGAVLPWRGEVSYELAVPWHLLFPAHPLLIDSLALNLVLVDRDGGSERRISMLSADPDYDTEQTPFRRGRMLPLVRSAASATAFAARVANPRIDADHGFVVQHAVHGAAAAPGLELEVWQDGVHVGAARSDVAAGDTLRRGSVRVPLAAAAHTGPAVLRVRHGEAVREDSIFLYRRAELDGIAAELDAVVHGGAPGARIRLEWLEAERDSAATNEPIARAAAWWQELGRMRAALRAGDPSFLYAPGVQRLAHRSRLDGTLQPYSLHLPVDFRPERAHEYPVLLVLHGSGVDEQGTIRSWGPAAAARGWVVIAPRARGLSDWYVGAAEQDVLEVLAHAAALYDLDLARVFVTGFSMGGYGAYRLVLRHPDRLRAAAILAGATAPPPGVRGESVQEMLDALAEDRGVPPLLLMHGALDQAVPVRHARTAREWLGARGVRVEYREVAAAGHGDPGWRDVALAWLERQLELARRR